MKQARYKRTNSNGMNPLIRGPGVVKLRQMEHRKVTPQELRGRGSNYFMGTDFPFGRMTVLEMDGDDGCTVMWSYLRSWMVYLETVTLINFILCILYSNKKQTLSLQVCVCNSFFSWTKSSFPSTSSIQHSFTNSNYIAMSVEVLVIMTGNCSLPNPNLDMRSCKVQYLHACLFTDSFVAWGYLGKWWVKTWWGWGCGVRDSRAATQFDGRLCGNN